MPATHDLVESGQLVKGLHVNRGVHVCMTYNKNKQTNNKQM